MRGSFEDNQQFRLGRFLVLCADTGEPWAVGAGVIAATINNVGTFSFCAGRLGAEPRKTRRSISPGAEIDASPAAPPPMLAPTTDMVFAPFFRR